jgi:hypothetical protein
VTTDRALFRRRLRLPALGREHATALAGLTLVVVVLLWRAIVVGEVFFDRDIHVVWLAQVEAFVRSVAAGSWPVWDPSWGFGQPLLANPSAQVLYPPNWTSLVLLPWTQYTLYSALHLLFGGVGVLHLARRHACSWGAASTAAAVWMSSGPVLSLLNVWHHFAGAAWLPWVLLAAERALDSRETRDALIWGAAAALQLLAGSPDMLALTGILAAAVLVAGLASTAPSGGHVLGRLRVVAIAASFGAGLAAAQWLPTLEVVLASRRTAMAAASRGVWSLHPWSLAQILLPLDFGWLPEVAPQLTGRYQELWQPFVRSVYLGAPALCLAVAGAVAGKTVRLRRALIAGGAGALVYALGRHTPLQGWIATLVPPIGMLRYPSKFTVALALAWALLAGLGFDAVAHALSSRGRRWLGAVALVACAACLAALLTGRLSPPGAPAAVVGLLERGGRELGLSAGLSAAAAAALLFPGLSGSRQAAVLALIAVGELVAANRSLNPTTGSAIFRYRPEVLDSIGTGLRTRIYVVDYVAQIPGKATKGKLGTFLEAPGSWPRLAENALAMQAYLYPPSFGRWGLSGSFDRDLLELYPRPLRDLTEGLRYAEETPAFDRLLRVGGVDFVVALHEEGHAGLLPVTTVAGLYPVPIRVYRVPNPLPRAYAVAGVERVGSPNEALRRLVDPGFDPATTVLLQEGLSRAVGGKPGEVRLVELAPDRVVCEATLRQPGFVLLLDAYDPGWKASVDGSAAPLLRANGVFRAVPVAAGAHAVEFRYRPASLSIGLAASTLSLVGGLAFALCRSARAN